MLRLPVSVAVRLSAASRRRCVGITIAAASALAQRRACSSVATTLPFASHSSCTEPKFVTGTMYENGSTIRVTRKYCPSGDASTLRIIAGAPIFRTAFDFTSMSASWPVV